MITVRNYIPEDWAEIERIHDSARKIELKYAALEGRAACSGGTVHARLRTCLQNQLFPPTLLVLFLHILLVREKAENLCARE